VVISESSRSFFIWVILSVKVEITRNVDRRRIVSKHSFILAVNE
jgi:hypothetical protein